MIPEPIHNDSPLVEINPLVTSRLNIGVEANIPLPEWAAFLIGLGHQLSLESSTLPSSSRQVVAVTVPDRNYAALLIATGYLLDHYQRVEAIDIDQHFNILSALTAGTRLRYRRTPTSAPQTVTYECVAETPLGSAIKVKVGSNEFHSVTRDRCLQLRPIETKRIAKAPLPRAEGPDLLDALLPPEVATNVRGSSSCDALIVGNKLRNLFEATEQWFSVAQEDRAIPGVLAHILRLYDMSGEHSRSRVESVAEAESLSSVPAIVIADGLVAMNVLQGRWSSSQHVIVLDRSDFSYELACQQIHDELTRWPNISCLTKLDIPVGMEVVGYTEKVRRQ